MTHVHPPIPQHHINRYDIQALVHTKSPVSTTAKYTKAMRAQVNEPTSVAEDTSMQPPASRPQPSEKTTGQPYTKRRESRFDPIGQDSDDDEGYGELGHRHPLRQVKEDEPKSGSSFSLPGIKSLLNPSFERDSSAPSTQYGQSPSLPSLVSSNSPSGSPSTLRTSRYSSLASGSSISAESQGWWAPEFERDRSHPAALHSRHIPPPLYIDEQDAKRRRSDQPRSTQDTDEQARMKWMAQSRNASFPTASLSDGGRVSTRSSPTMGTMHPPAHPTAAMSRQSRSQQDHPYYDRRPSAVPRSLSTVSGTLTSSFAELSSNERERERDRQRSTSYPHDMPPPFPSPLGMDRERRFLALQNSKPGEYHNHHHGSSHGEIQKLRHHTATPPETYRASSHPSESEVARPNLQRAARSSLSEMIMAQSGDDRNMSPSGRLGIPSHTEANNGATYSGWHPTRRSSGSSTQSTSTPGMSVTLNSDDGHTPMAHYSRDLRQEREPASSNPMGGMDVLAESARRVSEEETRRGSGTMMDERDREDSPRGGGGPGGPKYQCAYCTKTFSRPSSLRIHTYSHTGERPFICQEPSCGRRFSVQSNLKRHAKVHQLGQAGGASLHQLHNGPVPLRGPGPGQAAPHPHQAQTQQHGYYPPHHQSQGQGARGYGYDNGYPSQPYPQPQPHQHQQSPHPRGPPPEHRYHASGREWTDVEEDELEDEDEDMEE